MEQTNDSFAALFEAEKKAPLKQHKRGEKVTAQILSIANGTIFLDVGSKSEGILDAAEFTNEENEITVSYGDTVEVYFLQTKDGSPLYTARLGSGASHAHLEEAWSNRIPVKGHVAAEIKGGFQITLPGNVRAFCPYSQMGLRRVEDPAVYVDTDMTFLITRFEEGGRNLVLSARAILEEERQQLREKLQQTLSEGDTVTAEITSIRDFGAFADLGGIDGLIPLSEIGWSRVENARDHFYVGQKVNVVIKSLDWEKERISLSVKETLQDPWDDIQTKFPEGSTHVVTISRLAQFGAFAVLAEGIEGLIHISKLGSGRKINHPREVVEAGQEIEIVIEEIDTERKRISLAPSDYQSPENEMEEERRDYRTYIGQKKKRDKENELGSFGALLKARMAEKK